MSSENTEEAQKVSKLKSGKDSSEEEALTGYHRRAKSPNERPE